MGGKGQNRNSGNRNSDCILTEFCSTVPELLTHEQDCSHWSPKTRSGGGNERILENQKNHHSLARRQRLTETVVTAARLR